ncbi:MAG: hypothetical protein NVS1B6_05800 [Steroidobacteraceae bacterium]
MIVGLLSMGESVAARGAPRIWDTSLAPGIARANGSASEEDNQDERKPKVPPPGSGPLAIAGSPAHTLNVGEVYNFTPIVRKSAGDILVFSIVNKPTWVVFNTASGQMTGTPGVHDVGTTANISIGVSDGRTAAALQRFSISVTQVATGTATLTWITPTQNSDGSALTNLGGYRILYGTSAMQLTKTVQITSPGLTSAMIEGLSPGTYYFAIQSVATDGAMSVPSNLVSKTI